MRARSKCYKYKNIYQNDWIESANMLTLKEYIFIDATLKGCSNIFFKVNFPKIYNQRWQIRGNVFKKLLWYLDYTDWKFEEWIQLLRNLYGVMAWGDEELLLFYNQIKNDKREGKSKTNRIKSKRVCTPSGQYQGSVLVRSCFATRRVAGN